MHVVLPVKLDGLLVGEQRTFEAVSFTEKRFHREIHVLLMMLGRIHLERKRLCCWKKLEDHSLHSCLHAQGALFSIPRRKDSLSLTAWPQIPPDKAATTADSLQNDLRPRGLVWEHFFYTCPCAPVISRANHKLPLILSDHMDCSLPGILSLGFSRQEYRVGYHPLHSPVHHLLKIKGNKSTWQVTLIK